MSATPLIDVRGKSVLITGAGGGLGRATALLLAAAGVRLALTDIDDSTLEDTVTRARAVGASVLSCAGDIATPAISRQLVQMALETHGSLDAVCNVAGVLGGGALAEQSADDFNRMMQVNCLAHLLTVQAALPALRARPSASIVNVASVGALVALPFMAAYCASKSAALGLTRAMAAELAPNIRCNAVCPGGIDSPMSQAFLSQFSREQQPDMLAKLVGRQLIKRFAEPEEIAHLIAFLVSDASSFITGAILPADGGHTAW